jgi:Protein of unknown function (DUF4239)
MELSWLDSQDAWFIVLLLVIAMLLAAELAFRLGHHLNAKVINVDKWHFGIVLGSLLGLLALLLSFTFSMAAQRYEARRQLMVEDAAAIGALYLRSSALPDSQRRQIMPLLRQYADLRSEAVPMPDHLAKFEDSEAQSRALLLKLWGAAENIDAAVPAIKGSDEVAEAVIDVASNHARRLNALSNRVPDTVIWMLLGAAIVGMVAIGYSSGLVKHRDLAAQIIFSILVCGTIYVVLDLDRPSSGLIQMDQTQMMRLQQIIDTDPDAQ